MPVTVADHNLGLAFRAAAQALYVQPQSVVSALVCGIPPASISKQNRLVPVTASCCATKPFTRIWSVSWPSVHYCRCLALAVVPGDSRGRHCKAYVVAALLEEFTKTYPHSTFIGTDNCP